MLRRFIELQGVGWLAAVVLAVVCALAWPAAGGAGEVPLVVASEVWQARLDDPEYSPVLRNYGVSPKKLSRLYAALA